MFENATSGHFLARNLDLHYCYYVAHDDGGGDGDDCDDLYGHDGDDGGDKFGDALAEDVEEEEENLLKLLRHWNLQKNPSP